MNGAMFGHIEGIEVLVSEFLDCGQFFGGEVAHPDPLGLVVHFSVQTCARRACKHSEIRDDRSSALCVVAPFRLPFSRNPHISCSREVCGAVREDLLLFCSF